MKEFSNTLYTKEALLKAAYAFTDICYVHLDEHATGYVVAMYNKENDMEIKDPEIYMQFENELIAQQTRFVISKKSKNIREMIVARALSSTMIGKIADLDVDDESYTYDGDTLMRDWFEE